MPFWHTMDPGEVTPDPPRQWDTWGPREQERRLRTAIGGPLFDFLEEQVIENDFDLRRLNNAITKILDCINYPKSAHDMYNNLMDASEFVRQAAERLLPEEARPQRDSVTQTRR